MIKIEKIIEGFNSKTSDQNVHVKIDSKNTVYSISADAQNEIGNNKSIIEGIIENKLKKNDKGTAIFLEDYWNWVNSIRKD
ncbi:MULTISPECIES: hypothetical protein [Leptospira]|uniref:hypothetical protein n=1 Tax=Leptospira TaxID=171 RepID=UPI00214B424A|nr:hypothetical protein [Leptospira sp. id769339]MCR1795891.1 hypothetical protein [Leptospira sp. id769339]